MAAYRKEKEVKAKAARIAKPEKSAQMHLGMT
jgi:hypothetical protein